jgi:hypothetical protein
MRLRGFLDTFSPPPERDRERERECFFERDFGIIPSCIFDAILLATLIKIHYWRANLQKINLIEQL